MAETTTGLRRVLGLPFAYRALQGLLGSTRGLSRFVESTLCPVEGTSILDVGCGPGRVLAELPPMRYVGFDPNPDYIKAAQSRFGDRGTFFVAGIDEVRAEDLGTFDLVLAKGVLHHLDDDQASKVCALARAVLAPNGRFVTMDPALADEMPRVARWLISRDRGRNVRTEGGYRSLAEASFDAVESALHDDFLRVPYLHAIMVCHR